MFQKIALENTKLAEEVEGSHADQLSKLIIDAVQELAGELSALRKDPKKF